MKQTFIAALLCGCIALSAFAQNEYAKVEDIASLNQQIQRVEQATNILKEQQKTSASDLAALNVKCDSLTSENEKLVNQCDSLQSQIILLNEISATDRATFTQNIQEAQGNISAAQDTISTRTLWAIIIIAFIVVVAAIIVVNIVKRIKSGASSIDEVRTAQEALQKAQTRMQEESVALDNKLADIIAKQLESAKNASEPTTSNGEVDHSLALKVADEIVRIETNLSRMDSSVKGFKQLAKAVQRIKDNFAANGYEIADMLGKPYNAGMKVVADFVLNENLEEGQQIITGITKPQVLFNGKLIQAAQITVSQNI